MARILGIDPGTIAMGYGMVENVAEELTTSFYGSLGTFSYSSYGC